MLVCLLSTITITAQKEKVYVYGVDFSQVKVYAANESLEDFAEAFKGINMLLITEPQKYDFTNMLDTRLGIDVEMMINRLSTSNYSNIKTFSTVYEQPNCLGIIKEYKIQQTEGVGVVLIAKFLNKATAEATYDLVKFDINTREIQYQKEVVGKARGFGLRNFWAGSVYSIIQTNSLKTHGYRGFVDGGFTIGDDFIIEANTSHGFQVNPYFYVGGGLGMHIYAIEGVVNLPIFANIRANFLNKKASPFVDFKLGASIVGASGLYTALAVGCKINRFDVSLGYTVQLTEMYNQIYHNSYYGGYYTYEYYTGNVGGLSIKVGMEF